MRQDIRPALFILVCATGLGVLALGEASLIAVARAQGASQCRTAVCRVIREVVDERSTAFRRLRGEKVKSPNLDAYPGTNHYIATKALPDLFDCTVYRDDLGSGHDVYACAAVFGYKGAYARIEELAGQVALAVPEWSRLRPVNSSFDDDDTMIFGYEVDFGPRGSRLGQISIVYVPIDDVDLLLRVEVRTGD